jgi:hypothetical protein
MEQEQFLLESLEKETTVQRRKLLPVWIKIFIWIFMIFGGFALLAFLTAVVTSMEFQSAFYGLETRQPLSATGLIILFLFVFKAIVAYGLWTEKDWAVDSAIVDAILGIAICTTVMVMPFTGSGSPFTFRLELALLTPYLIKLLNIRKQWKSI